jgi:hypothetical protein
MRSPTVLLAALVTLNAGRARAQAPDSLVERGQHGTGMFGVSIGMPAYGGQPIPQLFTVGVNATGTSPGRIVPDFSIGTMPRTLSEGLVVLGLRGGVALPLTLAPNFTLLPSAGISLIGASVGGGIAGVNAGVAGVIWTGATGIRSGVTWHHFQNSRTGVWLIELGLVRGY